MVGMCLSEILISKSYDLMAWIALSISISLFPLIPSKDLQYDLFLK